MLTMKDAALSKRLLFHEAQTWTLVISPALLHWKSSATMSCTVALTSNPLGSGYSAHLLVAVALPKPAALVVCGIVRTKAKSRLRGLTVFLGSYNSIHPLVPAGKMLVPVISVTAQTASSFQCVLAVFQPNGARLPLPNWGTLMDSQ